MSRRPPQRHRLRDALVALASAAAAGTLAGIGWAAVGSDEAADRPPGDRVRAALADFASGDHVHVAPDARDRLSEADEAVVEEAVAAADPPLYVALWDADAEPGYWIEADAADQLAAGGPEEGVYVVWAGPGDSADAARGGRSPYLPADLFLGEPRLRLPELARAVSAEGLQPDDRGDYWGGTGGAVAAGVLFGGLAAPVTALVLVVGAWLLRRRRLPGGWR